MKSNLVFTNKELSKKYDSIFSNDSTKFFTSNLYEESCSIINSLDSWQGLDVLEIGCGEGNLASMISYAGAKSVYGIDYSESAINNGKNRYNISNVKLECKNYKDLEKSKKYDVIILQGVLEHLDNPFIDLLNIIKLFLKENGTLITSSPSFINPRGWVLMTLHTLFDIPVSLTDKYFLCPFDFEDFCSTNNFNLSFKSTYLNWASGEATIRDFNRRLRNALQDGGHDNSKVDKFLEWYKKTLPYFEHNERTGAMVTYKITIQIQD